MKKRFERKILMGAMSLSLVLTACNQAKPVEESKEQTAEVATNDSLKNGTYAASAEVYDRELNVEVEINDGKISDITLLENHESEPVIERAFPILKERIIEANSPDVDSVSAATISSYAVKEAVLDALKEAGLKEEIEITRSTGYEEDRELVEGEDVTTDLLIIGGGPAGLSAAIDAKLNGVEDVIIIEKLDILSGNGKFDMNFFDMANSEAMKANDNEVTKEEYKERFLAKTWDSEDRVDTMTEGAFVIDEWLRDKGIELDHNYGGVGGMSHMRNENEYAGNHIQTQLEKKVDELGVEVLTGTKAVDLILDEEGAKGALVEDKTTKYAINSEATIIATGGFAMNEELVAKYIPEAVGIPSSNQMGATGDFITIAEEHNIKLDHMDKETIFHKILDPRRDLTGFSMDNFIFVNKNGERFISEKDSGLEYGQRMMEERPVFFIFDEQAKNSFMRPKLHVEKGYIDQYDSIEELADAIGCSKETLETTIDDFNDAVKGEKDDEFREEPSEHILDANGPLYCTKITPALHMTKGGIVADGKAQVLDTSDNIISGLFAAGEVTDTSGAYASSVIFGRVSGQSAADFIKNK